MTDQQTLFATLVQLGLTPKVFGMVDDVAGTCIEVVIEAQYGGVFGNQGLQCAFLFDSKGNHVRTGVWKQGESTDGE